MASYMHHKWSVFGLVVAFFELGLAYFLLCGSVVVFFLSKFFFLVGPFIPCSCSKILRYQTSDLCLHKILVDWPLRKIYAIQHLVWSSLPFHLVWLGDHEKNTKLVTFRDIKSEYGETDLSSVSSSSRLRNLDDKEHELTCKIERVMNQKHKTVLGRRNRRPITGYGNSFLLSPSLTSVKSAPPGIFSSQDIKIQETLNSMLDVDSVVQDDEITASSPGPGGETRYRTNDGYRKLESLDFDLFPDRRPFLSDEILLLPKIENEPDAVKILRQALQEERAARATLYMELEKERAAAATAADETIAMMLKLQAEKASLKLEAKQYERVMEQKFAYDKEEINILTEILVKKERENYLLEQELEAYKYMKDLASSSGSEASDDPRTSPMQSAEQPLRQGIIIKNTVHDVHMVEDKAQKTETGPVKDSNWFLVTW